MSEAANKAPAVNGNQVIAAGFAAATAAFVTSRFGVAGTLLGAAVTAMIITGGSAILKSYFESVSGHVRKVPSKIRSRREHRKADRYAEPETLPDRPDLRDNFAGRLRAALDWFSTLPPLSRRSILVKGLLAAAVAFVISMAAVWGVEKVINNSLSCGFWGNCPQGATPGVHLVDRGASGAGSSITFGRSRPDAGPGSQGPLSRRDGVVQDGSGLLRNGSDQQNGSDQNGIFQQGDPGFRQPTQGGSGTQQRGGLVEPARPAEPEPATPVQPETPSSASPAPEQPVPGEEPAQEPQDASPAPAE